MNLIIFTMITREDCLCPAKEARNGPVSPRRWNNLIDEVNRRPYTVGKWDVGLL